MESNNNEIDHLKKAHTAQELLNHDVTELPWFLKDVFPKVGLVALAGSSDVGKSALARQLSLSTAKDDKEFLGFELLAEHNRALYVSTEDEQMATSYLLQKQIVDKENTDCYQNLAFVFRTENLLTVIKELISENPVDVVVIDTFTDLYSGDMNSTNEVRTYIQQFGNLAIEYNCLVIFMHHTGKRTESLVPSKDNLLGSQGFEAKMRGVIELRQDFNDPELRHFCIVKGNYIPGEFKKQSFVLRFDENLLFTNTNERVDFELLKRGSQKSQSNSMSAKDILLKKVLEYHKEKMSVRAIHEKLKDEDLNVSTGTINNWIRKSEE